MGEDPHISHHPNIPFYEVFLYKIPRNTLIWSLKFSLFGLFMVQPGTMGCGLPGMLPKGTPRQDTSLMSTGACGG